MSAISSSVINKSSKKIAPKAKAQPRRTLAGPPQPATKASGTSQKDTGPQSVTDRAIQRVAVSVPQPTYQESTHEVEVRSRSPEQTRQQHERVGASGARETSRRRQDAVTQNAQPEIAPQSVVQREEQTPSGGRMTRKRRADGSHKEAETTTQPSQDETASILNGNLIELAASANRHVDGQTGPQAPGSTVAGHSVGHEAHDGERQQNGNRLGTSSAPQTTKARRSRRNGTPDDSENVEITPSIITMADLCKDLRTGKRSKREQELQNLDQTSTSKKRSQQQDQAGQTNGETADQRLQRIQAEREREPRGLTAPTLRLVNGKMVLDEQSLQIDRHANIAANAEALEEIEESELTRRVTSGSWMKRVRKENWDLEMTDLFYRGLRMFGTDFQIISGMFPGRTRRHIKLKFVKEERLHPERVRDALLASREKADLSEYAQHTKVEYEDPDAFERELAQEAEEHEAQQRRLMEEAEAEEARRHQRQENEDRPPADRELSPAQGEAEVEDHQGEDEASARVDTTEAQSKKSRRPMVKKKQAPKKPVDKRMRGQEVEVLGTIDDANRR